MFVYWAHWTCLLILNQQSSEHAVKVASAIRLSFLQTEEALRTNLVTADLDQLQIALEHDFELLTDLLQQGGPETIERKVLALDFKVMRVWYEAVGTKNLLLGKGAIAEMSSIVRYFASEIGQSASA